MSNECRNEQQTLKRQRKREVAAKRENRRTCKADHCKHDDEGVETTNSKLCRKGRKNQAPANRGHNNRTIDDFYSRVQRGFVFLDAQSDDESDERNRNNQNAGKLQERALNIKMKEEKENCKY